MPLVPHQVQPSDELELRWAISVRLTSEVTTELINYRYASGCNFKLNPRPWLSASRKRADAANFLGIDQSRLVLSVPILRLSLFSKDDGEICPLMQNGLWVYVLSSSGWGEVQRTSAESQSTIKGELAKDSLKRVVG
jgi:hypothetical protein